jgi:hypothetical protein
MASLARGDLGRLFRLGNGGKAFVRHGFLPFLGQRGAECAASASARE